MAIAESELAAVVVEAVRSTLTEGTSVELDGLGVFRLSAGELEFYPERGPRVFIAYVAEESEHAVKLARALQCEGMHVWIDKFKLRPGQDWRKAIERAIERADFFIPCFSKTAVRKRGQFPYEIRFALRCADRMPLDDNFIAPVRLEECEVPRAIQSRIQYVDLFPEWERGVMRLVHALTKEHERRVARSKTSN